MEVDNKEIKSIKSYIRKEDAGDFNNNNDLSEIIKKSDTLIGKSAYWILYNQNKVLIGQNPDELVKLNSEINLDILKEIRLFNPKGELHVWKYGNSFKYRIRLDNDEQGEDTNIYIETHFRLPLKNEPNAGRYIKEALTNIEKLPQTYIVYNYFDYNKDTGLMEFYDARVVDFVEKGGI